MALNAANVSVAVTGAVSYAPTGSTAPTDATTALDAAFKDVGYISSDGVTETRDRSTQTIVAWQNSEVVRAVVTESSITVQFTMIETNKNSVELFYGDTVSAVDGGVEIRPGKTGGRRMIVVDYVDGSDLVRLFLPSAEVMEVGDLSLTSGDAVGYDVTITGYPGTNGWSAKKWITKLDTTP
jgi:hypothetical protein